MSSNKETSTKLYYHKTAEECSAFTVRIKAKARKAADENVGKLVKGTTVEGEPGLKANAELFDIIVDSIGCDNLVDTIANRYNDDGVAALAYIKHQILLRVRHGRQQTRIDVPRIPIETRCDSASGIHW